MGDVTPLMDAYRECVRHLWNTYFQREAEANQDWDHRDEFNAIAAQLFRALVLRKLGRESAEVRPDHWAPRKPLPFLQVVVEPRSEIMVNREIDGGYWDHPLTVIDQGDLELHFVQYFDWADLAFRDFAYYRVRIVGSAKYPDVVGKDALIPAGPSVKVLGAGAAERRDEADEAREG